VAKDVVKQVLESDELKPEGRTCRTTILTSDLRDFTRFSNSMSAERVVQTLNIYFADMIEVFVAEEVQLDKFIGDGILAYVEPGAETLEESNARGVRAALAMQEKLHSTNEKLKSLGLPELKLGVAVHAGDLVLGNIGAPVKMQYTIIGDAVNVASRLEGFCKVLGVGVVVSSGVYESLPADLQAHFQDCGEQEVRGVEGKLRLFGAAGAHMTRAA
jgi:adenylate cyclase